MGSDTEKFTRLVEVEIVSFSILIGFFFSMVLTVIQQYRSETLGGVYLPFIGWISLQAGIVITSYLTLLFFFVFIVMNIIALERSVFEKWEKARELHRWSLSVLVVACIVGAIALATFSVLVVPQQFLNPLLSVLSISLFVVVFLIVVLLIAVFVVDRVAQALRSRGWLKW